MPELTEQEVKIWQQRIRLAKKWREPKEKKWKENINFLQGYFFKESSDEDQIAVNVVFPTVRVIIPAIYSKNPEVQVFPRRNDEAGRMRAEVVKDYLNYLIKEIKFKAESKLELLDALICGHGWDKIGYYTQFNVEEGYENRNGKPLVDRVLNAVGIYRDEQDRADSKLEEFSREPLETIIDERAWSKRVSPFDMLVAPYSKRLDTTPWIAERIVRTKGETDAHPTWRNAKKLTPIANARNMIMEELNIDEKVLGGELSDPDMEYVVAYEVWDIRNQYVHVIPHEDCGSWSLEDKENPYPFLDARHPYFMLRFNEINDEFYPMDDITPWIPQQHELNSLRTQMNNHRKRFNRRYIARVDVFDDENIEIVKSGEDGSIAMADLPDGVSTKDAISPIQDATLTQDVYSVENRIRDDITNISGITDFQRGSLAQGAKSATEAAIVESQSRFRTDERLDVVTEHTQAKIRALAQLSFKFADPRKVARAVGTDTAETLWPSGLSDEDIKYEFDFNIEVGSTVPMSPEVEKQQFIQAYPMLSNDPFLDPIKIRTEFIRKLGYDDPESWLAQTPPTSQPPTEEEDGGGPPPGQGGTPDRASLIRGATRETTNPTGSMPGRKPLVPLS